MQFAWFPGCKISYHQPQYGRDALDVCAALGLQPSSMEFNCCGWPLRQESLRTSALAAARNFALAHAAGLDIVTPCKCCYGNLKVMAHKLQTLPELRTTVDAHLQSEGLSFTEIPRVLHLLTVMDRKLDRLRELAGNGLGGSPVAASYGCHALRPSEATDFDDPLAPTVFERVLRALGADPVPWQLRVECCGHFMRDRNDAMADSIGLGKLRGAAGAGAETVATACTYCQMQFEGLTGDEDLPAAETVASLALRAMGRKD